MHRDVIWRRRSVVVRIAGARAWRMGVRRRGSGGWLSLLMPEGVQKAAGAALAEEARGSLRFAVARAASTIGDA